MSTMLCHNCGHYFKSEVMVKTSGRWYKCKACDERAAKNSTTSVQRRKEARRSNATVRGSNDNTLFKYLAKL